MISEERAKQIAADYGKRIGLTSFSVEESFLNTEVDEPVWRVSLWFERKYLDEPGEACCVVVEVNVKTGETYSPPWW